MYEELMTLAYNIEDRLGYTKKWGEIVNKLQSVDIDKLISTMNELLNS